MNLRPFFPALLTTQHKWDINLNREKMKTTVAVFIASVVLVAVLSSASAEWKVIERAASGETTYSLDLDRTTTEGAIVTFWRKDTDASGKEIMVQQSLNCKNDTFAVTALAENDEKGNKVKSLTVNKEDIKWIAIPADSVMDTFKAIVCSGDEPEKDLKAKYESMKEAIEKHLAP